MNLTTQKVFLPFGHPEYNIHTDIPSQRADIANITVNPLLQITIIDKVIHEHPVVTNPVLDHNIPFVTPPEKKYEQGYIYLYAPSTQYPKSLTRFLCRTRPMTSTSTLNSFSAWPLAIKRHTNYKCYYRSQRSKSRSIVLLLVKTLPIQTTCDP